MIFARWRARRANRILIDQIHGEIVAAARAPALYTGFRRPRRPRWALRDGDVALPIWCCGASSVLGPIAASIAQDLVDCVFQAFEDALREMSISDAGVAKRMKSMAAAFYGRNKVYAEALAAHDSGALAAALARNAYRGATTAEPCARAGRACRSNMQRRGAGISADPGLRRAAVSDFRPLGRCSMTTEVLSAAPSRSMPCRATG